MLRTNQFAFLHALDRRRPLRHRAALTRHGRSIGYVWLLAQVPYENYVCVTRRCTTIPSGLRVLLQHRTVQYLIEAPCLQCFDCCSAVPLAAKSLTIVYQILISYFWQFVRYFLENCFWINSDGLSKAYLHIYLTLSWQEYVRAKYVHVINTCCSVR